MIVIVRDTWRAVLVLVVGTLLTAMQKQEPPSVATQPMWAAQQVQAMPPAWQPVQVPPPAPPQPLRRVASALTELGDSMIGVVRR